MSKLALKEPRFLTAETYALALGSRYGNVCFDQASGRLYPFKEAYYPTSIGEGAAAFQSYAEQMRKAESAFERSSGEEQIDPVSLFELIDGRREATGQTSEDGRSVKRPKTDGSTTRVQATAVLGEIDSALSDIGFVKADYLGKEADDGMSGADAETELQLTGTTMISERRGLAEKILRMLDSNDNTIARRPSGRSADAVNQFTASEKATEDSKKAAPSADLLTAEPLAKNDPSIVGKLVVGNNSRILLVASAGHGKTTILRRVALYYCDILRNRVSGSDAGLARKYGLPSIIGLSADTPIPCLIELRDISITADNIEELLIGSIKKTLHAYDSNATYCADEIKDFISIIRSRMILLIDGLDELADEQRASFLAMLNLYLRKHDQTPVILTSRVAGVLSHDVRSELHEMQFRGRTVLPLSERQSREYSEQWIAITQSDDDKEKARLLSVLDQIFSEGKFSYLKDFMRTPLELGAVLKQLSNGMLSLSRYQLFHDMLWDFFTRHEEYSKKSSAFEDSISILSLIAYWMQVHTTLFVTKEDVEAMLPDFEKLSLYSDEIDCRTAAGVTRYLEQVASNIGVIEKDGREGGSAFTFPIRAYQEYLTAYACCHLCLDSGGLKPDPKHIAESRMNDPYWNNVMCFLLIELEAIGHGSYTQLLNQLFDTIDDLDHLQSLIESDIYVDYESACTLSDRFFAYSILPEKESELLSTCARSKSFPVFDSCIERRHRSSIPGKDSYLWAASYLSVYRHLNEERQPYQAAKSLLLSKDDANARQGASMIDMILGFELDDRALGFNREQLNAARTDVKIDRDTLRALYNRALCDRSSIFVQALSSLWVSRVRNFEFAGRLLGGNLRNLMLDIIADCEPVAKRALLAGKNAYKSPDYVKMRLLLRTLGSIPFEAPNGPNRKFGPYTKALFECLYERSRSDYTYNATAFAIAGFYVCWDEKRFEQAWCFDVCTGRRSEHVSKAFALPRERNLFELVRSAVAPYEETFYREMNPSTILEPERNRLTDSPKNRIEKPDSHNASNQDKTSAAPSISTANNGPAQTPSIHSKARVGRRLDTRTNDISYFRFSGTDSQCASEVDLFREGDIKSAIKVCRRGIETATDSRLRESRKTNLAFLIRYAASHGDVTISERLSSIPELLAAGVAKGEPYALTNLGLYFIEIGEAKRAGEAFSAMSEQGWRKVSEEFWRPVMWQEKQESEGALVCILAERLGGCDFEEHDEMLQSVERDFSSLRIGENLLE